MDAADYANDVQDLFVLPDVYLRLQELMNDDRSSIDDFADVIALDTALSAKVLKLANSALYNFAGKISTLSQSINLIGSQALYNLALANGAADAFSSTPEGVIDLNRFWKESADCALILRNLASRSGQRQTETYFLLGLLHNIGELVVAAVHPEKATECEASSETEDRYACQMRLFGFSYADCGAELLKLWNLPENLVNPIAEQCSPLQGLSCDLETRLLSLAITLTHLNNQDIAIDENFEIPENIPSLSHRDISEAIEFANVESLEVLTILNPMATSIY